MMKADPRMQSLRENARTFHQEPRWKSWSEKHNGHEDPTIAYHVRYSDREYAGGYNENSPRIEHGAHLYRRMARTKR